MGILSSLCHTKHKDNMNNNFKKKIQQKLQKPVKKLKNSNKLSFSDTINQKTFIENTEDNSFDITERSFSLDTVHKDSPDVQNLTNIAFDNTKYKFIIDDCFYRMSYSLPKSVECLNYKNLNFFEKQQIKQQILDAIQSCKQQIRYIYRIDSILLTNSMQELYIITELNIFKLNFCKESKQFLYKEKIKINDIDFISLSSDGTMIIIHIIPKIGKNLVINHENLNNLAGCLAANNLVDKFKSEKIGNNRKLTVVYFNKQFCIVKKLIDAVSFEDFTSILNKFLQEKLEKILCVYKYKYFKFTSVMLKINPSKKEKAILNKDGKEGKEIKDKDLVKDGKDKDGKDLVKDKDGKLKKATDSSIKNLTVEEVSDLIITDNNLLLLDFKERTYYVVKAIIEIKEIANLTLNKESCSLTVFDNVSNDEYEIRTESFNAIFCLLSNLSFKKKIA